MSVVVVATVVVIARLWVLEHLDIVAVRQLRECLAGSALLVIVVAMFAAPATYRNGMAWFIDRKTNEMLEQIQPVLDDLPPPSDQDIAVDP